MSWTSSMGIGPPRLPGSQIDFLDLRTRTDVIGRPAFQYFAEMQNPEIAGEIEHDVHVVLDEKERDFWIELLQELRHLRRLAGREPGRRLRSSQNVRIPGKAEHELRPALSA